ncbi:MAG: type II toxin-antitoxin system RelB/DinJ family antitoxin [Lachnospiraceae bacterium]|nr:type II toxin-antitoxin system RelB/DinJ family antitoxin [Lachnospiraceae bacterium]
MASTIQIRVDDDLKKKSDQLFKDLGTDTTSAIRMFLTQAVANNGFPFEIKRNSAEVNPYAVLSEDEILERLSTTRTHSAQGKQKEAKAAISEMRSRYGL